MREGERRRLYVIDTSSVIAIRQEIMAQAKGPQVAAVHDGLAAMVESGEILLPEQVIAELKRGQADVALQWALKVAKHAVPIIELALTVRDVVRDIPYLVDATSTSSTDDADPWVVGLALLRSRQGEDVTVLTEEYRDRPDRTTVSSACGMLRIPTMTVRAFLLYTKIWPK
jgi:rRNA maturation endonuclease Nob1